MSSDDPFGRRGEEDDSGLPGGWLPPSSGREPEERKPLWSRPESPGHGPPVFEQPGPREPAAVPPGGQRNSGQATASLVLGIVGLLICPLVCSVLALVYGYRARREIDGSGGRLTGRGNATAGIVLGWVGIALGVLFVVLVAAGTFALDSDGGSDSGEDPLFSLLRSALA